MITDADCMNVNRAKMLGPGRCFILEDCSAWQRDGFDLFVIQREGLPSLT